MSTPEPTRYRPTHINGVEVIEVEHKVMVPHPYHGDRQPIVQEGCGKALLADGSVVYYCEGADGRGCEYSGPSALSVRGHRNGTHNRSAPHAPLTPEKSIRAVIRAVEAARANKVRGYCGVAAEALNAAGIPSGSGKPWTGQSVSQIYNTYREQYPVRLRRRGEPKPTPALPMVPTPIIGEVINGGSSDELTPQALRGLAEALVLAARQLAAAAERLDAPAVDPELVEKARKYDALRGLIS